MDENERIDLGVWDHDDAWTVWSAPLEGLPAGVYRLYAERVPEKPLEERMEDQTNE